MDLTITVNMTPEALVCGLFTVALILVLCIAYRVLVDRY